MGFKTWAARKGAVGGTARWAARGYYWYDGQFSDYNDQDMYRALIKTRVIGREKKTFLLSVADNINGLLGLVVAVLTVEAGFMENSQENQDIFMEVIGEELLKLGVPSAVITGIEDADEDEDEENIYPFSPSMPDITACEVEHINGIGEYAVVLVKNAPTLGETTEGIKTQLKYTFVAAVVNVQNPMPEYFVTLETGITGKSFLCVFDRNGNHHNFGAVAASYDEYNFSIDALEIIEQEFGLQKAA